MELELPGLQDSIIIGMWVLFTCISNMMIFESWRNNEKRLRFRLPMLALFTVAHWVVFLTNVSLDITKN